MDNFQIKDTSFEGPLQIDDNFNGSANISKQLEESEFYQKFMHDQNIVNETDQNIHKSEESHINGEGSAKAQQSQLLDLSRKLEQSEQTLLKTYNEKQKLEVEKATLVQQKSQLAEELENASIKQIQMEQKYQSSLESLKQNHSEEVQEELNHKCSMLQTQVDDQKKQLNFKLDEIKQFERVNDQYKQEINSLKKHIAKIEDINAEVKAKGQAVQEENNQLKEEQNRSRQQLRHFHQENLQLRKEIDILNAQKEKFSGQIQDLKLTIRSLQQDNENLQKNDQVVKLKFQLEAANQDINRYRAMIQNGNTITSSVEKQSSPAGRGSYNARTPIRTEPITHQYYSPKPETQQEEVRQQRPQLKQNYIRQLEQSYAFKNYNEQQENEPKVTYRQPIEQQRNKNGQYNSSLNENNRYEPPTQRFNTLQVGGLQLSNYDHICSIESSLMQLQGKKTELEGQLQKLEQQKLKTQVQLTRKRELESQIEKITNQVSNLRKDLRSYNALK